jgi:hypothetical protein
MKGEVLVRIVMQQAMEDERLRERLLLRTSRAEGLDLAAFRWAVDDAVDFDDYLGSPWDCASGIQNVVGAIAELLEEGFAPEVVELSEYALARIEGARAYDVDGTLSAAFSKGWRSSLTKPASGWSRTRRRWRNGSSSGSWAATTIRSSTQ